MKFAETQYGFEWGPLTVHRVCSDQNEGWVCLWLETRREKLEVHVTPTGFMRVMQAYSGKTRAKNAKGKKRGTKK